MKAMDVSTVFWDSSLLQIFLKLQIDFDSETQRTIPATENNILPLSVK